MLATMTSQAMEWTVAPCSTKWSLCGGNGRGGRSAEARGPDTQLFGSRVILALRMTIRSTSYFKTNYGIVKLL